MDSEKDRQHAKVKRIAEELTLGCTATFDTKGMQGDLNALRVNDADGSILYTSPDKVWMRVETVKEMKDEEVRNLLRSWIELYKSSKKSN